jgi:hypothetical protein
LTTTNTDNQDLIDNTISLYTNLQDICNKYNGNAKKLDLKTSYEIKKNKYSLDLAFKENNKELNLTLEQTNESRLKVTY